MRSAAARKHPSMETLALYPSGDLPLMTRWRTRRHIRKCQECEQQIELFCAATNQLKHEANTQVLTAFEAVTDWNRLEREMLGNIAVGVAAARCIDKVGRSWILRSRGAWVTAGLVVLFIAGWFTHIPREQREHLTISIRRSIGLEKTQMAGTIVQTTPLGIAVRAQGATLTLLHPASAVVSLAGTSSLGARYVDEETGEVTITNVYGQ